MYKHFCDSCLKQIRGVDNRCIDCGSNEEIYHRTCLKKINGRNYCPVHAKNHVENGLIIAYLKNTWRGLNLGGELSVRGILDADSWSEVVVAFPGVTLAFKGTWDTHSKTLMLKSNRASTADPEIHRIKLHHHAGFRTALKAILTETVTKYIADCEKAIKTHEREIKGIRKTIKKEQLLLGVLTGKTKWPKPKPEPLPQEPVNDLSLLGT